jgi:hypothetical protein
MRLTLLLSDAEAAALMRLAALDDRDPRSQARVILRDYLMASGAMRDDVVLYRRSKEAAG